MIPAVHYLCLLETVSCLILPTSHKVISVLKNLCIRILRPKACSKYYQLTEKMGFSNAASGQEEFVNVAEVMPV